jgi:hypothetical protein
MIPCGGVAQKWRDRSSDIRTPLGYFLSKFLLRCEKQHVKWKRAPTQAHGAHAMRARTPPFFSKKNTAAHCVCVWGWGCVGWVGVFLMQCDIICYIEDIDLGPLGRTAKRLSWLAVRTGAEKVSTANSGQGGRQAQAQAAAGVVPAHPLRAQSRDPVNPFRTTSGYIRIPQCTAPCTAPLM